MTDDQRRMVSTVLTTMADTLPVWRDTAVMLLVGVVVCCLVFWSVLYDG